VTINGKSFDDSQLDNLFRAVFARDKETSVVIRADKTVPQARIVKLLDAAKRAGLTHLSIGAVTSAQQPLTATGGTTLEVPSAAASLAQSLTVMIVVPASGNVMVGGKPIPDAELDKVLREAAARSKDTRVIIQADKNTQYGRVVGLMDRAKQAGLTRIAIGTAP
jgi:biopolymer transport protein ExbD